MDLVTADGGFDFSTDFNNQELQIAKLVFAQIAFALVMQKQHGNFVLKIFDCFYKCTIDLLALLSSLYKTVYITKPQTSRLGNSEKYVVCKDYLYNANEKHISTFYPDIYSYLYTAFSKMLYQYDSITTSLVVNGVDPSIRINSAMPTSPLNDKSTTDWIETSFCETNDSHMLSRPDLFTTMDNPINQHPYITEIINIPIPYYFIVKIEEYNSVFGGIQIENIHNTLTMIERNYKSERIDQIIESNLRKCVEWCSRYNIPHNVFFIANTFSSISTIPSNSSKIYSPNNHAIN